MSYRTEHRHTDISDVADEILAAGWEDASWHNDACPRFVSPDFSLTLWVDDKNPAKREVPDGDRFYINPNKVNTACPEDYEITNDLVLATNDFAFVRPFLRGEAPEADEAAIDEAVEAATDAACAALLQHLGVDHGDHAAMYWHGSQPRAALANLLRDYLEAERADRDASLG